MNDATPVSATRTEFIEKVGLITQAEGLPRIAGRVFGLLIFDGEAVSFGDLATRLQVSRGSISSSIRLLEERGLVKRVARPGDRQDYFQLAPNPYISMLEGLQKRIQAASDEIAQTMAALPPGAGATDRLRDYAAFHAATDAAITTAIDTLKAVGPGTGSPMHTAREDQTNDH